MDIIEFQQYSINNASGGSPVKIYETPSVSGKVIDKLVQGNVVGRATGRVIPSGLYEDNTIINWVEFEEDPYGYPPVRYVQDKYIQKYGNTVLPVVDVTATGNGGKNPDNQIILDTDNGLGSGEETYTLQSKLIIGGILLSAALALIAMSKK